MAIKPLSKVAPSWYTPESEEGSDKPTRFKLRPLTPPERESVMVSDGKHFSIPPRNYGEVLKMGIVDWENFGDEKCTQLTHWMIPADIRLELASEILLRSNLDEEDAKN